MGILKIHCGGERKQYIEVDCTKFQYKEVESLIWDFKRDNKYLTSVEYYIDHLKKHGFKALELHIDMEVY